MVKTVLKLLPLGSFDHEVFPAAHSVDGVSCSELINHLQHGVRVHHTT